MRTAERGARTRFSPGAVKRTLTRPQPAPAPRPDRSGSTLLAGACAGALDVAVLVLSTWTVVYHLSLVLGIPALWAAGLELVTLTLAAGVWWRVRRRPRASPGPDRRWDASTHRAAWAPGERVLLAGVLGPGALAAVLVAADVLWPVVSGAWLVSAATGTALAATRLRRSQATGPAPDGTGPDDTGPDDTGRSTGALVALAWATALAVLASLTRWPNPDDLYYVNLSQWVVDHGTFPLRDTIFSDLVFPMSSWPPVASYDALAGTVALLTGVPAASVVYLVVPPVATFLSVLALWQLLRVWRVAPVAVALSFALAFLLLDGGPGYAAPGNLFLTRIWQGKVILLALLVPVLLGYAVRYVERPTRARAAWLFAGGVAAVGLSTTAMFLVPLLALAGAAPLALRRPARALLGFAAMAAYPLAAGALTLAVGGRSADAFGSRRQFRFDPAWFGHEIFRDGPLALVAVGAVLAGAVLVPHRGARVTTGVLAAVTGVTLVPGMTQLAYDLVGLGPTLWRVSWVATIAALVGVLGARALTWPGRRAVGVVAAVALAVVLVADGVLLWSPRYGVTLDAFPHWKRGTASVTAAQRAIEAVSPGDVVLAPEQLAITITVLTTRVKTVAPRGYFMDRLRDEPGFSFAERSTLVDFANRERGVGDATEVERALRVLDVDEVCLPFGAGDRIGFLRGLGYEVAAGTTAYTCLTR